MSGFESVRCPVCGSGSARDTYPIHYDSDRLVTMLEISRESPQVRLRRCEDCGHHYANPQVTAELMDRYYSQLNSEYYCEERGTEDHLTREHDRIRKMVEHSVPRGRILDAGCGYGHLLSRFDPSRWDRHGIDPSPRAVEFARSQLSLDVTVGFVDRDSCPANAYDVVMVFDVFEHLKELPGFLEVISDSLRPGGMLVVGTGDVTSLNARLWRGRWIYYGSWEHVSFFSPSSMRKALESAGFEDVKVRRKRHSGTVARNVIAMGKNVARGVRNSLRTAVARGRVTPQLSHFELAFDHMIATCRRPESTQ